MGFRGVSASLGTLIGELFPGVVVDLRDASPQRAIRCDAASCLEMGCSVDVVLAAVRPSSYILPPITLLHFQHSLRALGILRCRHPLHDLLLTGGLNLRGG